jgi:F-type H+-transporting ATPase subunit b
MDALGISGWNIAFQFVNFLIFIYLMYRLLFRPITGMLHRRRERIGESLREAEDLRGQVERERAEFQSELSEARLEAQRIRDDAARSAEAMRTRELDRAREESDRLRNDAQAEIERSRVQVREDIRRETAGLVLGATARVLDRSIDDPEHRRLVQEALAEVQGEAT